LKLLLFNEIADIPGGAGCEAKLFADIIELDEPKIKYFKVQCQWYNIIISRVWL